MKNLKLIKDHRLYINRNMVENLPHNLHNAYLKDLSTNIISDANRLLRIKPVAEGEMSTYQQGTRTLTNHIQCLTAAYILTKNVKYRNKAVAFVKSILNWKQISCEANHTMTEDMVLPFCLTYGEMSTDISCLYDVIKPTISEEEQKVFIDVLDKFFMKAALNCLEKPPWWANKIWSNWNGVCAGGMGMMMIAFYEEHPEAKKLFPFVEKSLGEYFKSYIQNGGGCQEGTGYWNYGMHYSMRYVLSYENATGKKHSSLSIKEISTSLNFPIDFTGITFGDNDGWHPACFYFILAKRLNQPHAALCAAAYLDENPVRKVGNKKNNKMVTHGSLLYAADVIPTDEVMAKLKKQHTKNKVPRAYVYKNLEWASLSDDIAFPKLRMSIRGGSDEVTGHGMIDLLSFRCRVNGELMVTDQQDGGYMSTTFTKRGHELYGRSPESKSTLFVDGLGCNLNVRCNKTEVVKGQGLLGIRVDGSNVFLPRWKDVFIGRVFLLVDNAYWVIVDHVLNSKSEVDSHWIESRFHTLAENKRGKDWVSLKSGKEKMQMSFTSLNESQIQESTGMPSQPLQQTKIFRWMSSSSQVDSMHAVVMNPGSKKLNVSLHKEKKNKYIVKVSGAGMKTRTFCLNSNLKIAKVN
jgi:hypothetical protein